MARKARKQVLLAKLEVTPGTDSLPGVSDAFLAGIADLGQDIDFLERENVRGEINAQEGFVGQIVSTVAFSTEFKSSTTAADGDSGSPHHLDALFQSSGMNATYTPEASAGANDGFVEYKPHSDDATTTSLYAYFDGQRHKILGALFNWTMDWEAGQFAKLNWSVQGNYATPAAIANPVPVPETNKPKKVQLIGLTIGAFSPKIRSMSIEYGSNIVKRPDANAAEGLDGLLISSRDTKGQMVIEAVTETEKAFFANLENGTTEAVTFTIGTAANEKVTVTIPNAQLENITQGNVDDILTYTLPFRTQSSVALNDQITVKFS